MKTEEIKECDECQREVDKCICPCTYGCDEGYFFGNDLPGFDYFWDDENDFNPCPSCRGTNLERKRTLW